MWIPDYDQAPYSTFTEPVPDPGTDPTVGPFVLVPLVQSWLPVVLGALQQLVQAGAWNLSTDAARLDVQMRAMQLIRWIAMAGWYVWTGPYPIDNGGSIWISNGAGAWVLNRV